jgi:hypothetical protein
MKRRRGPATNGAPTKELNSTATNDQLQSRSTVEGSEGPTGPTGQAAAAGRWSS